MHCRTYIIIRIAVVIQSSKTLRPDVALDLRRRRGAEKTPNTSQVFLRPNALGRGEATMSRLTASPIHAGPQASGAEAATPGGGKITSCGLMARYHHRTACGGDAVYLTDRGPPQIQDASGPLH